MTNEEAKNILFDMLGNKIIVEPTKQNQAILTAIKALEQEPKTWSKVTNAEEAEAYPISESITKDFEEFTK